VRKDHLPLEVDILDNLAHQMEIILINTISHKETLATASKITTKDLKRITTTRPADRDINPLEITEIVTTLESMPTKGQIKIAMEEGLATVINLGLHPTPARGTATSIWATTITTGEIQITTDLSLLVTHPPDLLLTSPRVMNKDVMAESRTALDNLRIPLVLAHHVVALNLLLVASHLYPGLSKNLRHS
jgi:hypothetical protein